MSKKIDLERLTWDIGFVTDTDVLALVRAVRAALACENYNSRPASWEIADNPAWASAFREFDEAFAAFTDSAESK